MERRAVRPPYSNARCSSAQERIHVLHRTLSESHFNTKRSKLLKFEEEFCRVTLLRMLDLRQSGCVGELAMMLMLPISSNVLG